MKTLKIIYWATTALIDVMMTGSAIADFAVEKVGLSYQHLGFPGYFKTELAIAKLIGAFLFTTHKISTFQ